MHSFIGSRRQVLGVVVLVAVIMLGVAEYVGLIAPIRDLFQQPIGSVQRVVASATQIAVTPLRLTRAAHQRYTYVLELEQSVVRMRAELAELKQIAREYEVLKGLPRPRRHFPIVSYAQPTLQLQQKNEVEQGALVFTQDVLIGRVSDVRQYNASVQLLSSVNTGNMLLARIDASESVDMAAVSPASGLLFGDGQSLFLKEIPSDMPIRVGQSVVTSGQVGVRPGLYIGQVRSVQRKEGASTQTAEIDQGVSFYTSTFVEVE